MAAFCQRQAYRGRVDPAILAQRLKDNLLSGAGGTVAGKAHSAQLFAELLACSTASSPIRTTPSTASSSSTRMRRSPAAFPG
jgi:hypothetical protein